MRSVFLSTPRRSLLALALASLIVPTVRAQPAGNPASDPATDLDDVVVTATRTAQTIDATLAAVTVITREDIDRRAPASLPDLLRGVPGLTIGANGGPGKVASSFLRGTDSDHVVVLIDGVRAGSATSGGMAFQDLPVEQIERVEIVRGPVSSLYGADAVGGVIQIFTRRPHGPFQATVNIGAGNFDTQRYGAGVSGRSDASGGHGGWYSVHAAHETTGGIDSYRDNPASPWDDFALDPDRDGYRNSSLSLGGGYRFTPAWDVEARALRAEGHNDYDSSWSNESDVVQEILGSRVRYTPSEQVTVTLNAGRSEDTSHNYYDGVFIDRFDTRRDSGSLQGDFGVGQALLSVGFDWREDQVGGTTTYDVEQRINRGLFGQWQQRFGAHALQASLRRDDDTQFGGETTGSVLWGWDFTDALRLTASYGTAYKAPTFNDLYFPGFGNAALSPETSASAELGLRGKHGWGGWSVNAFQTRVDDLIAYDPTPTPTRPFGQPNNIDKARIHGVEVTTETTLAGWSVQANATWLDPRNDSGGFGDDNLLPRRPRLSGRIDVDRSFGAWSVGGSVNGAGERYDDPGNFVRVPGYGTTDVRVGYRFAQAWSVQLNLDNVFDKDYETVAFYPQPGRSWFVSLRYSGQ
ncbi:TonB-dependent vitamin B12 receptor [Agrilutibacter solisilvae]|uniref:TonB-dependent vitamin B12 receptor n=1 Tax=Agrilutibacter solisilvae TaxID=2763317 RepID=A0A974XZJ1_9GAMM|nr:TonB-dependent vitamin B12 receptor [Lysobacter solisilvae]QSX78523.1 TonB-dependent vitamin B12 receptor [Lysobacter solisilvae]